MDINLSTLTPPAGSRKKRKRVGRGPGSGHGKTSTRGHKGQYSRSGSKRRPHKEGGQMPLYRRLPKRGFHNLFRVEYQVVNVSGLAAVEQAGQLDVDALLKLRLVRSKAQPIKILGDGAIDKALVVQAHAFTRSAREKITAAGGSCETVPFIPPQVAASAAAGKS